MMDGPAEAVEMTQMTQAGVQSQAALNAQNYFNDGIAKVYTREPIQIAEMMIALKYSADFFGKRVLDLGVGTGRTTRLLLPFCAEYVGIDLSDVMLKVARRQFPTAQLSVLDIREIGTFGPSRFDFVLGPHCILDAVSHSERVKMLADLHTIVAPGGLLVFSSHNRRYRRAGLGPQFEFSRNPVTQLGLAFEFVGNIFRRQRTKQFQVFEKEYAIINDRGCKWRSLHYYIDRATEQRQLAQAGFDLLSVYDEPGRVLGPNDDDSANAMLYYVARRLDA
jgi:SAM-dependent methyltransferase